MFGLVVMLLIGIALLIIGYSQGSLFFMIVGVVLIVAFAFFFFKISQYSARKEKEEEVTNKVNELKRLKEKEERDRKLAELDYYFDNWLAKNGGFWIVDKDYPNTYNTLTLIRRDGSEAFFALSDYGYDHAVDTYYEHLSKRLIGVERTEHQLLSREAMAVRKARHL